MEVHPEAAVEFEDWQRSERRIDLRISTLSEWREQRCRQQREAKKRKKVTHDESLDGIANAPCAQIPAANLEEEWFSSLRAIALSSAHDLFAGEAS
jgi:hypothetical protein